MGRRKGRNISGWLVVDKPAGLTSTAVVNKVRWAFGAQKAGHAGTLDPAATGILAVALGEATKTVPFVTDALKAYAFTVRFGLATNTDDAEGEIVATSDLRPDDKDIVQALQGFLGEIEQVPPKFSAIKIDGQRAYAMARAGEDIELAARPLFVESLTMKCRPDLDHAELELVCGKGGYVRSIARDLGEVLGCLGHVVALRRLWSGPFDLSDAITLQEVVDAAGTERLDEMLLPVSVGLDGLPELVATADGAQKMANGNPGAVLTGNAEYGEMAWASFRGQPVAVGRYMAGELHPTRVFRL